ncbi:MAG TPA: DUF1269 domain-containing protein [Burkholderiaceae bacterium]|nr:DUF1269 domain-containing protein [Burkholderiaceae bacterium]
MERMLVVVFDNETKAFEGKSALRQLEREGDLTIYAGAVVTKHADGTAGVRQYDDFGPVGSLVGTSAGSLIGLLGGPVGVAIGASSGLALGALVDIGNARVGEDFVADVSKTLTPNKVAVIAEVEEGWTTPVDTRMETLGGTVLRRALWEVEDKMRDEKIAAMKTDVAQFKEEMSKAHEQRKAKLKAMIEQLETRIDAQAKKAKADHEAFKLRQHAKRELLKKNAAAAGKALKELAKTPL